MSAKNRLKFNFLHQVSNISLNLFEIDFLKIKMSEMSRVIKIININKTFILFKFLNNYTYKTISLKTIIKKLNKSN